LSNNGLDEDLKIIRRGRQASDGKSQLTSGATVSLDGFGPGGNRGVRATNTDEVLGILESTPGGTRGKIRAAVQNGRAGRSGDNRQNSHEEES
jgi:hypothetical protein